MTKGIIRKLKSLHKDNEVLYKLPLGDKDIELSPYIGKKLSLKFTGNIFCLDTGRKIKKSYGQGYSWEAFNTLAQCDSCIMKPQLCHYSLGTCREPEWGEKHCLKPHIIYLANTGTVKIGITRKTQVPTRWIDQGASYALPILEVKDRKTSGLIEVEIAKKMADKTNWRKMLKNDVEQVDLYAKRDDVFHEFSSLIEKYNAKKLDEKIYEFHFPVKEYPTKVSSLSFEKNPHIESKLVGIRGQYLIFEKGVINIRRHQGFEIELS